MSHPTGSKERPTPHHSMERLALWAVHMLLFVILCTVHKCSLQDERGSSQSTTDTESGTGSETATTHDELTRPPVEAITERPVESQSDTDGGGSEREGRKVSASRQGRKLRKSAASGKKTATEKGSEKENETGREETGREEVVGEEGSVSLDSPVSGTGDEGGEDEGGGRAGLDSAELYSPQVSGVGSPTRDTIKLGPIRYIHCHLYVHVHVTKHKTCVYVPRVELHY